MAGQKEQFELLEWLCALRTSAKALMDVVVRSLSTTTNLHRTLGLFEQLEQRSMLSSGDKFRGAISLVQQGIFPMQRNGGVTLALRGPRCRYRQTARSRFALPATRRSPWIITQPLLP